MGMNYKSLSFSDKTRENVTLSTMYILIYITRVILRIFTSIVVTCGWFDSSSRNGCDMTNV